MSGSQAFYSFCNHLTGVLSTFAPGTLVYVDQRIPKEVNSNYIHLQYIRDEFISNYIASLVNIWVRVFDNGLEPTGVTLDRLVQVILIEGHKDHHLPKFDYSTGVEIETGSYIPKLLDTSARDILPIDARMAIRFNLVSLAK
jgi:hypothetical protein